MKVTFDPSAAEQLEGQIDYLLERHAHAAARHLEARCTAFRENFLAVHPRTRKYIAAVDIWETWIPGTQLVLWYRFSSSELQVLRIWHAGQDRQT